MGPLPPPLTGNRHELASWSGSHSLLFLSKAGAQGDSGIWKDGGENRSWTASHMSLKLVDPNQSPEDARFPVYDAQLALGY